MKQRIGICTNFGNCLTADSKKKVPITGGENFCPSCGSQLTEYKSSSKILPAFFGLTFLLLIVFGASFFIWQQLNQKNTQAGRMTPPSLAVDSNCLLDRDSSNDTTVAQAQQRLPMTYVPALKQYPIPRDLHAWMKNVDHISESAFFIMRREVTVGEFKDYFVTLSEREQLQLGYNWQQDRHGAPLPDDYPVGSIPWSAAKDYANEWSKKTGCYLTLPTYNQWISAAVQYAHPDQAATRQHQQSQFLRPIQRSPIPETVMDLLGNLREWSKDKGYSEQICPDDGHYILGEDYKTWLHNIGGEPICETMALDTIGFRLVRLLL